jgi:hypothetical protein
MECGPGCAKCSHNQYSPLRLKPSRSIRQEQEPLFLSIYRRLYAFLSSRVATIVVGLGCSSSESESGKSPTAETLIRSFSGPVSLCGAAKHCSVLTCMCAVLQQCEQQWPIHTVPSMGPSAFSQLTLRPALRPPFLSLVVLDGRARAGRAAGHRAIPHHHAVRRASSAPAVPAAPPPACPGQRRLVTNRYYSCAALPEHCSNEDQLVVCLTRVYESPTVPTDTVPHRALPPRALALALRSPVSGPTRSLRRGRGRCWRTRSATSLRATRGT